MGCGGSGSSGAADAKTVPSIDATPALSSREFVQKANAICSRGSDRIHGSVESFKQAHGVAAAGSLDKKQEEEFISEIVVPAVRSQAEKIAKVGAPQGELAEVAAIVNKLEKVADAGEENPASILKEAKGNALSQVNEAARKYGIRECEQP
jgi:hypothetical protein